MSKIYLIREQKVMMDFDLAELYGIETKMLKRAVKRNMQRFPPDFMFELSQDEQGSLRRQIGTLKRGEHSKYKPFAFTEQGVAMLSSVLNSPTAINVNIQITCQPASLLSFPTTVVSSFYRCSFFQCLWLIWFSLLISKQKVVG